MALEDQCCYCYCPGGAGLGRLIERRQQEILAALTKTMPTCSEGLPLVFSVFVRIRSLIKDQHGNQKGKLFPRFAFAWQKPHRAVVKGYGK